MSTIEGGCLCGAVRYSSPTAPAMQAVCHCRDCQRQTGTAFSIVFALPLADLTFDQGTPATYTTTGVSGAKVVRHFCSNCGSPLYSAPDATPGMVFVKAGTLDDPSWLKPDIDMWCETAQPWLADTTERPRFEQNPPFE